MYVLGVCMDIVSMVLGIVVVVVGIVVMIVVVRRGLRRAGYGDLLIVLTKEGMAYMENVEPFVPPTLYTYKCPGSEMCLLVVRNPPIMFYDPRIKSVRKLWIGVEMDMISVTVSPQESQYISLVGESVGEFNVDDIVRLAALSIEKKSYTDTIVIPPNVRVSFTFKIHPTVVKVLTDILRYDSVALTNILSALRSAREAKALAEAVAIRKGAEVQKWLYIGILVMLVAIAIAIIMVVR